jgi:hypothetical protein
VLLNNHGKRMDFGLLPEVNSGCIYTGPGPGPMLAIAARPLVCARLGEVGSGGALGKGNLNPLSVGVVARRV